MIVINRERRIKGKFLTNCTFPVLSVEHLFVLGGRKTIEREQSILSALKSSFFICSFFFYYHKKSHSITHMSACQLLSVKNCHMKAYDQ